MGQGGYSWETVYNMPLWLRRFTYNMLLEHYQPKKDEGSSGSVDDEIRLGIERAKFAEIQKARNNPTYSTKASKK
jgi:hypothetical protein